MNDLVVSSDKHFKTTLFGLNKGEVYAYLNQVGGAYEELQLQIQVLRDQNDKLADSNRDNALKVYNLQNDVTEAQKKADRLTLERDAARKEAEALHKELEAAEKRIEKLTDELIKTGADVPVQEIKLETTITAEDLKGFTPKPIFGDDAAKEEKKEGIRLETVEETPEEKTEETHTEFSFTNAGAKKVEPKTMNVEEPKGGTEFSFSPNSSKKEVKPKEAKPMDIFAEMKASVAEEKKAEAEKAANSDSASSASIFDEDEVYAGEVEVKVDESMLIGNDDDEEEGFTFL